MSNEICIACPVCHRKVTIREQVATTLLYLHYVTDFVIEEHRWPMTSEEGEIDRSFVGLPTGETKWVVWCPMSNVQASKVAKK